MDARGTFTDLFYLDEASRALEVLKARSTAGNPSVGLIRAPERSGVPPADLALLGSGGRRAASVRDRA